MLFKVLEKGRWISIQIKQRRHNVIHKTSFYPLWLIIIWAIVGTGCAFTEMPLDLPPSQATTNYSGGEDRVILLPGFADERTIKNRIGMKKNTEGADTAPVLAKTELSSWFTTRLGAELKAAGFQVINETSDSEALELRGALLKYFIEPVWQGLNVDIEADISVRLRVKRFDGFEAERKYYVKGVGVNQGGMTTSYHYVLAQKKAVDTLMNKVVSDLIKLLNKYPTTR